MPVLTAPFEPKGRVQVLENGATLNAEEFLRRFEAEPSIKKAELVDGIVFMGSPVRIELHAEPDGFIQTWLGNYRIATPGTAHATNATVHLGKRDVPQPDGLLRILPECGGKSRVNTHGYLVGAPDLVVEVAASSSSLDARQKRASYLAAQVQEYLLWRIEDEKIDWWALEEGSYKPLPADEKNIIKSRAFPGLWLNSGALLGGDAAAVLETLQEGIGSAEHQKFIARLEAIKSQRH